MAQIEQIQIKFVPIEDRLLMRVASQDNQEFRFWMTRRYIQLVWPALAKSLTQQQSRHTPASDTVKREVLSFEHEKAVVESDFKTPFKEVSRTQPLGDAPLLLSKFQLRRSNSGAMVLAFSPEDGAGIDLAVEPRLLHSLISMIEKSARAANWNLPPLIDGQTRDIEAENITVN